MMTNMNSLTYIIKTQYAILMYFKRETQEAALKSAWKIIERWIVPRGF